MAQRRRSRVEYALLSVLGLTVLGLGAWTAGAAARGVVDPVALSGFILATIALIIDLLSFYRDLGGNFTRASSQQADDLAGVVEEEWQDESKARRLRDPKILPLSWAETHRSVSDDPTSVVGNPRLAVRLRLAGRLDDSYKVAIQRLADAYNSIPSRRLVVLGEPGAGKSVLVLMLTLGLLRRRRPGEAVPVLLAGSSWEPLVQDFDEWIVHSLATAYYNGDTRVPQQLLQNDLILPIIDGLDEIPESERRTAIRNINRAIKLDRPVVVTCRSVEYQDLIEGGAPTLRRAPVVEVAPVPSNDTITYLSSIDWPEDTSWNAVYDHIRHNQHSPVAEALSTPLMVTLARTVYERLGGHPSEMLNEHRFDSRHSVEEFLTERIIDAAYACRSDAEARRKYRDWDAAHTRRWLTSIAQYMHRYRERELIWWLLSERLLSPWVAPSLGIIGGALLMIGISAWIVGSDSEKTVSLSGSVAFQAGAGATFAVLSMVIWYAAGGTAPGRLMLTRKGSASRLRRGFLRGFGVAALPIAPVLVGIAVIITLREAWGFHSIALYLEGLVGCLLFAAAIGVSIGVHNWLNAPPERAGRASPVNSMRQDRQSSYVGSLAAGIVAGLLVLPCTTAGIVLGSLASNLATKWAGWPGRPSIQDVAQARLSDVKNFFETPSLFIGGGVLLPGVVVATLVLLTRAWPRFLLFRSVMAFRGQFPWRLPSFLADARDRDVLRQSAGAYQFRHIRLQETLATRAADTRLAMPQDNALHTSNPKFNQRKWARSIAVATLLLGSTIYVPLTTFPTNIARATLAGEYGAGPYGITLSPDGSLLAASSENDSTVHLWDVTTGRAVTNLPGHGTGVRSINFSPDRRILEAKYDQESSGGTTVWNVDTGQAIVSDVNWVEFVAGGRAMIIYRTRRVPGRADEVLELWDTVTGRPVRTYEGISPLSLSRTQEIPPNASTIIVTGSDNIPSLFDAKTGEFLSTLTGIESGASQAEFSPDGSVITALGDSGLQLWNAATGQFVGLLANIADDKRLKFDPRGDRIATTTGGKRSLAVDDDTVKLWNTRTGQVVMEHIDPNGFGAFEFTEDGRTFMARTQTTGESPGELWLWDAETGRVINVIPNVSDYGVLAKDADYRPVGELLNLLETTIYDRKQIWNGHTGKPLDLLNKALESHPANGLIEFSMNGSVVVFDTDNERLRLAETTSGSILAELPGDLTNLASLDFSPDGRVLMAAHDGRIDIYEAETGRRIGELENSQFDLMVYYELDFSPDGRVITGLSREGERALVWDADTALPLGVLAGHSGPIYDIEYSADSQTIITAGALDDTIRLWDVPR